MRVVLRVPTIVLLTAFLAISAWAKPIDWSTPEGVERLSRAEYKADFFQLAPQFEGQVNKVNCGVASAVIVLNTLRAGKGVTEIPEDKSLFSAEELEYLPQELGWNPYWERYTQNVLMDMGPKPREELFGKPSTSGVHYGLTLAQEVALLERMQLKVAAHPMNDLSNQAYAAAKAAMIEGLRASDAFVVVNFYRPALGQKGGGHFSPLGAYDAKTDSFLLMDVTNTTHTWIWVTTNELSAAMRVKDSDSGVPRGFLVVKEGVGTRPSTQ